jgi:hypothetical protein
MTKQKELKPLLNNNSLISFIKNDGDIKVISTVILILSDYITRLHDEGKEQSLSLLQDCIEKQNLSDSYNKYIRDLLSDFGNSFKFDVFNFGQYLDTVSVNEKFNEIKISDTPIIQVSSDLSYYDGETFTAATFHLYYTNNQIDETNEKMFLYLKSRVFPFIKYFKIKHYFICPFKETERQLSQQELDDFGKVLKNATLYHLSIKI